MKRDPFKNLRRIPKTAEKVMKLLEELESLTIPEAAALTGMGQEEARRRFPVRKLGPKTHRIPAQAALAYLRERTVNP